MRGHLRSLCEVGVIERRRRPDFPGAVDYELGLPGRELLDVADVLAAWLAEAPDEPLALGSPTAKNQLKALVEGWNTTIVRALAARPLSLTELDRLIPSVNYPSLERRLAAMRLGGQVSAEPGNGRRRPHAVSDWLRRAVAPFTVAARWERDHAPEHAAALSRIDVQAAFLLAVPALRLDEGLSGSCRLVVSLSGRDADSVAGVRVRVERGVVAECSSKLAGEAVAWASGSRSAWFRAVIDGVPDQVEVGGDSALATAILDALHSSLFAPAHPAMPRDGDAAVAAPPVALISLD